MPTTLDRLKNKYSKELGDVEDSTNNPDPSNPHDAENLRLNKIVKRLVRIRTLFHGYLVFHQQKSEKKGDETFKEEDYFEFFRSITKEGARAEAIVCATASLTGEKFDDRIAEEIYNACNDWNVSIHEALQFATIEYLTNASSLKNVNWFGIIKILLKLGADPNFACTKFHTTLVSSVFDLPLTEIKSSFMMAMASSEMTDQVLALNQEFAAHKKTPPELNSHQCASIFPKIKNGRCFIKNPWLQFLEKNFPDKVKKHLQNNQAKIIAELADNQDYDSIEHFREKYGIDPFPLLIEKEEKAPWIESSTFKYLDKIFHDRVFQYIQDHHDKVIDRFNLHDLAAEKKYDVIDHYRKYFGLDLYYYLRSYHFNYWLTKPQPLFQYLEERDSDSLKKFVINHRERVIEKISLRGLINQEKFELITHFVNVYQIDIFSDLMKIALDQRQCPWFSHPLISYLETHFLEKFEKYLNDHREALIEKFMIPEDTQALERLTKNQVNQAEVNKILEFLINQKVRKKFYELPDGGYGDRALENICENKLFKWLETVNPLAIRKYFLEESNDHNSRIILRMESSSEELAVRYDIDPFIFFIYRLMIEQNKSNNRINPETANSESKLSQYHVRRSKIILDFIFAQDYPKAAAKPFWSKDIRTVSYNGKSLKVSADLASIIDILQKIIKSNNGFQFQKIGPILAGILKKNRLNRDLADEEILIALGSLRDSRHRLTKHLAHEFAMQDKTLLGEQMRRELDSENFQVFLMGTHPKDKSTIRKMCSEPLFDRKLLAEIFPYVADDSKKKKPAEFQSEYKEETKKRFS